MTDYVVPILPRRPRTDYIDVPDRIKNRTTAKKRGWYAGWPDNCPPASARSAVTVTRSQDGKQFTVRVDSRLASLVGLFLSMSMEVGYPLIGAKEANSNGGKQGGVGSYVCRAIKGSDPPKPSNHSSATALDLYTRSNPQRWSSSVKFWSTIHPNMVELAAAGDLYWGGWYWDESKHTYMDAMHFEYMRRPEDVAGSIDRLKARYQEIADGIDPPDVPEEPVDKEQVKVLQASLNKAGWHPALVVDGVYGPLTESAVIGLPSMVEGQVKAAEDDTKAATKDAAVHAIEGL